MTLAKRGHSEFLAPQKFSEPLTALTGSRVSRATLLNRRSNRIRIELPDPVHEPFRRHAKGRGELHDEYRRRLCHVTPFEHSDVRSRRNTGETT
jgi:hypothetical protein